VKLLKSKAGKVLIILYYVCLIIANVFVTLFIIVITGSILAGLGISLALGIGIGILGGELEFREHLKQRHKKYFRKREPENVITFPDNIRREP